MVRGKDQYLRIWKHEKSGKKQYERDFLLQLQRNPLSMKKPVDWVAFILSKSTWLDTESSGGDADKHGNHQRWGWQGHPAPRCFCPQVRLLLLTLAIIFWFLYDFCFSMSDFTPNYITGRTSNRGTPKYDLSNSFFYCVAWIGPFSKVAQGFAHTQNPVCNCTAALYPFKIANHAT